jgi:hypothetical protein
METIIEIIHHTNHLKPVAQLEVLTYVTLIFLTVSLGIANVWLREGKNTTAQTFKKYGSVNSPHPPPGLSLSFNLTKIGPLVPVFFLQTFSLFGKAILKTGLFKDVSLTLDLRNKAFGLALQSPLF